MTEYSLSTQNVLIGGNFDSSLWSWQVLQFDLGDPTHGSTHSGLGAKPPPLEQLLSFAASAQYAARQDALAGLTATRKTWALSNSSVRYSVRISGIF